MNDTLLEPNVQNVELYDILLLLPQHGVALNTLVKRKKAFQFPSVKNAVDIHS